MKNKKKRKIDPATTVIPFIIMNGYHKSAVPKAPIKKVNYDTIHKRIQRAGNFIV